MKCSDKEWQHYNKEKMGCNGCAYNDEISIGDYVRSWNGTIGKVTRIEGGRFLYDNKELICFIGSVVKHSKDIIDLIEQGDYVNGVKIRDICEDDEGEIFVTEKWGEDDYHGCDFYNEDIKSVITKEQIKQIEYRIKE